MADTQDKQGPGITTLGDDNEQGIVVINTKPVPEKPSILCLYATADTTGVKTPYYLWVDSTGDLRIHSAIPTNQDSDGNVVGAMS